MKTDSNASDDEFDIESMWAAMDKLIDSALDC